MQAQIHPTNSPGYERRWLGLIFIGISLIVISLDNTILNVAIPSISRTLGANASELQWIIDAYVLVFAALLLTMGGLGDRFGRKRALQVGLVLFGLGSLAGGAIAINRRTDRLTRFSWYRRRDYYACYPVDHQRHLPRQ